MSIKVKVSGINLVLSGLDKYSEDVQKLVAEEVKDWADRTEAKAKQDVPVDTGALKSSIRAVGNPNRLSWSVKVGGINGVNYAPYVVFGTGSFVNQSFLQEFGLVQYASQFKGAGIKEVNLPMRDFFFKNARTEFEKTFQNIKKLLENK
jgi:hypothetical protein